MSLDLGRPSGPTHPTGPAGPGPSGPAGPGPSGPVGPHPSPSGPPSPSPTSSTGAPWPARPGGSSGPGGPSGPGREFDALMSAVDAIRTDLETPARPRPIGREPTVGGPVLPPAATGKGPTPGPAAAMSSAVCGSTGAVVEPGAGASSGRGGEGAQWSAPPRPVCGHCCGPLRGYGGINRIDGDGPILLCHPDYGLNCYGAVTVYGHTTPCEKAACLQEGLNRHPWTPLGEVPLYDALPPMQIGEASYGRRP